MDRQSRKPASPLDLMNALSTAICARALRKHTHTRQRGEGMGGGRPVSRLDEAALRGASSPRGGRQRKGASFAYSSSEDDDEDRHGQPLDRPTACMTSGTARRPPSSSSFVSV